DGIGRNRKGAAPAERERSIAARDDAGAIRPHGDMDRADLDGSFAEGVREANADGIASDAGVYDFAQRLVAEHQLGVAHLRLIRKLGGGAIAPGSDPVRLRG